MAPDDEDAAGHLARVDRGGHRAVDARRSAYRPRLDLGRDAVARTATSRVATARGAGRRGDGRARRDADAHATNAAQAQQPRGRTALRASRYLRRADLMVIGVSGASFANGPCEPVFTATILSTTSMPDVTLPNTV